MELEVRETLPILELLFKLNVASNPVQDLIERIETNTYDYSDCPCCQPDFYSPDDDVV